MENMYFVFAKYYFYIYNDKYFNSWLINQTNAISLYSVLVAILQQKLITY